MSHYGSRKTQTKQKKNNKTIFHRKLTCDPRGGWKLFSMKIMTGLLQTKPKMDDFLTITLSYMHLITGITGLLGGTMWILSYETYNINSKFLFDD